MLSEILLIAGLLILFTVLMIATHNRDESLLRILSSVQLTANNCKNDQEQEELTHEDKRGVNWRVTNATQMTAKDIVEYLNFANRSSCALIHDFGGVMNRNPSGLDGQKAVCLDTGKAPIPNNCTVYSFGINNEWSFDDFMERYGCEVFTFDPTMQTQDFDRSANIHFYQLGLENTDGSRNGWKVSKLSIIYEMLKNSSKQRADAIIDYLKIDIEV